MNTGGSFAPRPLVALLQAQHVHYVQETPLRLIRQYCALYCQSTKLNLAIDHIDSITGWFQLHNTKHMGSKCIGLH